MLTSATGQTLCRYVAAVRKIVPSRVPKGVGEEIPAKTENSSEQEGSLKNKPLPQDTTVLITMETPTPRATHPVISITKEKVE